MRNTLVRTILFYFAAIGTIAFSGAAFSASRRYSDHAPQHTKRYQNKNFNFSFEYPANWHLYQGFDRNGVTIYPFSRGNPLLNPSIGVGGAVGQPGERAALQTLQEELLFRLSAMKTGPNAAKNLTSTSEQSLELQGLPALVSTVEFDRGSPAKKWVLKQILIHTRDDRVTFHLVLMCHPDDLRTLQQPFDEVVKSFRILGPPA